MHSVFTFSNSMEGAAILVAACIDSASIAVGKPMYPRTTQYCMHVTNIHRVSTI